MKNTYLLGIDWGEKRIGLSLGDIDSRVAVPYLTVETLEDVLEVVQKEQINIVVIGEPLSISGSRNSLNKNYKDFLSKLRKSLEKIGVELKSVDERFSSKAADALSGDSKTKASRDAVAAMIILQSYFDKIK